MMSSYYFDGLDSDYFVKKVLSEKSKSLKSTFNLKGSDKISWSCYKFKQLYTVELSLYSKPYRYNNRDRGDKFSSVINSVTNQLTIRLKAQRIKEAEDEALFR